MAVEWCPRCQKNVDVWMKAVMKREGNKVTIQRDYSCIECRQFLKSTSETMNAGKRNAVLSV